MWNLNWSSYGSVKDEDDGVAIAKFCNDLCQRQAGPNCEKVTLAMRDAAREKELREPEMAWREETDREKYDRVASEQKFRRLRDTP